ncbi:SDR family oxidoreductase [Fodinicola feengrottensis]|uniref:SDR family oxidoreductase n=1 Tax=Fodinicola feengrottensis TaxID=435914 RepID=A0ABP4TYZ9_9ACTN|nr:SDR family NAD(P)-dependent oxidoreductase [Fodinicola feengrottensis]
MTHNDHTYREQQVEAGMELSGAGIVVTGAGRGIGAALARRFAADGARLVLADLDGDAVGEVAAELGGLGVGADISSAEGNRELVAKARENLGEIDIFFANAGTPAGRGIDSLDSDWQLAWQVNVMAHVYAARELMPAWVQRGRGHFVSTASAAGLLTMIGAAPYSVTKHGAVAFAEWLSITYGDQGITVQCLCPQGVRTAMLAGSGEVGKAILGDSAIEPEEVADTVAAALQTGEFLILPHPEAKGYYEYRAAKPDRWLAGMRDLQKQATEQGNQDLTDR